MAHCAKISYPSSQIANLALKGIRQKGSAAGRKLPVSVYRCPDCNAWHLTSKKAYGKPKKGQSK
jgi:hypothetical protein